MKKKQKKNVKIKKGKINNEITNEKMANEKNG